MSATAVVPIRSFDGMTRLASDLGVAERNALVRSLAERLVAAIAAAGASAAVVTGDPIVGGWAAASGCAFVEEAATGGLDGAAAAGIATADGPWLVIHADLPLIDASDIAAALDVVERGETVLAPSHDGGTSLIGASGPDFPFSYGVGSFRRHLAAAPAATVLVRPGLALDLDRARDLPTLRSLTVRSGRPSLV